jgi:hypothetical protein
LVVFDTFNEAETVSAANEVPKCNCVGALDATTSSLSELIQYTLQFYEVIGREGEGRGEGEKRERRERGGSRRGENNAHICWLL